MKRSLLQFSLLLICLLFLLAVASAQTRSKVALISIDSRNLEWDNTTMANIVRFELEKIDQFEVLDKYDVNTALEANAIDANNCFGKNSLIEVGKLLGADKMITGSSELFGDKIILILKLIDIRTESVERTSVMEYLNAQSEIQTMCMISLNDMLGIPNDPHLVDLLINYNLPITTKRTTVSLNGPRMGASMTLGSNGDRLMAPKKEGGYNMFPVTSMFGYQFEKQYMSSGDFQALVEMVVAVNGLESGEIIPSINFLNGFRFNNGGYEFGLGPVFRLVRKAEGYFKDGNWTLVTDDQIPEGVEVENLIDSRGDVEPSLGIIIAAGKTFQSGYLNIPVNIYFSPVKNGSVIGFTIGFNTTKKPTF